MRRTLHEDDAFLLGTDLVKDPARLVAAYDDAQGVTAEFNKNVLAVLDRELGADFKPDDFEHRAVWDAEQEWIEMRLESVGRPARARRRPRAATWSSRRGSRCARRSRPSSAARASLRELAEAGLRLTALVDGPRR